mgnify:FL=1
MKTILSYSLSIPYYLCFGILLFSFQIIQWFCLNMFGYYAHKKSVDILNYLILLSLSIIKTRIFFEAESNLPPPGKNVIFIANHQSTYDIPPLIWKLRNYHMKFVSKKELGRGIPSISYNLRNGGSILIDREKPKEAINSIKKFGKFLSKKNFSVLIFPEGTRSKNGKVKKFHRSGLKTLIKNIPDAIIVPISIKNSWKFSEQNYFPMPLGVKIIIRFHKSISNDSKNLECLIDTVESTIHKQVMS